MDNPTRLSRLQGPLHVAAPSLPTLPLGGFLAGILTIPFFRFSNLQCQLTDLREALSLVYYKLVRDTMMDTDEHPDEEGHRARSGRFPSTRASVQRVGRSIPLAHGDDHQPKELSRLQALGIFMKPSSHRHDQLSVPSPVPYPHPECLGGGWNGFEV